VNPQVDPEHYFNTDYDSKERFCSYWQQIYEISQFKSESVLEIGIGNGFVSRYLKTRSINITTLDIDRRLNPDITASAMNIPFRDDSFQTVACYELLEHIPYKDTAKVLSEICRVAKEHIILSVPDVNRYYRIYIHIPKTKGFKKLVPVPGIRKPKHRFDGHHYWEIGKAGYSLKKIVNDLEKQDLQIERTYRVYEMPYHRFFILRKNK